MARVERMFGILALPGGRCITVHTGIVKVIFDIVHPAHVHFYKNLAKEVEACGGEVLLVGRDRDVIPQLLESLPFPSVVVGHPRKGRMGQAFELLSRVVALAILGLRFKADVICSRNPAGILAALILPRTKGVFDTDDGPAAGSIYKLAAPFATMVTAPDAIRHQIKVPRVSTYRGFKASAYLHPSRFTPDESALRPLGVAKDSFAVVRFVSMSAVHDRGESGMPEMDRWRVVDALSQNMRVLVSSEDKRTQDDHDLDLDPARFLDVLGHARVYVGDSQSTAAEACLMGTPALHSSSWSGRLEAHQPLVSAGLLTSLPLGSGVDLAREALRLSEEFTPEGRERAIQAAVEISEDVTGWYFDLLRSLLDL